MNEIQLSHVALLVPSVRKSADYLCKLGFEIGELEEFEGEGTREIYVEGGRLNSLLLLEPFNDGPYRRALSKRGPGVHHIAIDVLNLDSYLESIASTGWLLHLTSLKTMKQSKSAYLARPGFPAMIEVQEKKKLGQDEQAPFVNQISLPFDSTLKRLLDPVGQGKIITQSQGGVTLVLDKQSILFEDLV